VEAGQKHCEAILARFYTKRPPNPLRPAGFKKWFNFGIGSKKMALQ
jgi:hypothetical protein